MERIAARGPFGRRSSGPGGSSTVRIAPQWERVVVLRLGKFNRIDGPGLYVVVPIVESVAARVDQRIITTPFSAEEAVTADLVPLGIDAVLFWMVWDPKDACVEVEDYSSAVWWAAQTALRDAVGRINLAEVATRREQLDNEVKEILEEKTRAWGHHGCFGGDSRYRCSVRIAGCFI